MKCPKCAGKLQERTFEDIEIDSCFVCEGLWFDADELEDVIKKDSKNFNFVGLDSDAFDGKEVSGLKQQFDTKVGACPRCNDGTLLVREQCKQNHDIHIDACPNGHGVWLDGGEILDIRKRFLVTLNDKIHFCINFIKHAYSLEGIKDMARSLREKKNKKI